MILKFLNIESSSKLKVMKFSLVTDLPSKEDKYSLFLNNSKIMGIKNVKTMRYPLEIKLEILKIVIKMLNINKLKNYM